ncbi:MAG: S1 RNA-binding domain-containing protein [Chloroflexi bacterium]|nr:S1 RNA-binding domain-containing protein [Chloroflexota bacterium]
MEQNNAWEEKPGEGYWNAVMSDATLAGTPASSGWTRAQASYESGQVLEATVSGHNRGGVLVELDDARGFVPASQLINLPRQLTDEQRLNALAQYVGQSLKLKVIELDRARNRLILSERVASPSISRADQILAELEPAQTRAGVIRNVTEFGAFIDLGGVEGLIHVSELAWQHVKHPREIVAPGQTVDVYILEVNRDQRRVACSLKRMLPNPWAQIAEKFRVGDLVDGVVTSVMDFGAFVRLAPGIEGLIHFSELANGNFLHPRDIVQDGQTLRVRVMSIDPERQRISLSLRRAGEQSTETRAATEPPMPPPPDEAYWSSLVQSEK